MIGLFKPFFPILYQGSSWFVWKRAARRGSGRSAYFEEWYFKHTTSATRSNGRARRALSFTAGIWRAPSGGMDDDGAFVQLLDGDSGEMRLFSFPATDFRAIDEPFELRIGRNRFSLSGLKVDLEDHYGSVRAELSYGGVTPPRRGFSWPGAREPYSFVPILDQSHGIASLDHRVDGCIEICEGAAGAFKKKLDLNGGRGYIEKDWGRSRPRSWVRVQCNAFDAANGPVSFFFSLARVPWLGSWFNGFIAILLVDGREYRFSSNSGSRIDLLSFEGSTVSALLTDRAWKLELTVRRSSEGSFVPPPDGAISRRVSGSADSWVRVVLKRRHGADDVPVFDASSPAAGVDVVGDMGALRP